MPRGVKAERNYTGKALEISEKIKKKESELKDLKEQLKIEYKEQLKAEKEASKKQQEEEQKEVAKLIKDSGLSFDEIKELLSPSSSEE